MLVDRDAYLLEVCRYVELNPVRAGMVEEAEAWPWSSHRAHIGAVPRPAALRWAHVNGGVTMTALAAEVGLSGPRVSRLSAKEECGRL